MPEFDSKTQELLIAMLLMAGLLAIVAIGIQVIAVYRRKLNSDDSDPDIDLAESIRDALEAGEISAEEYQRIRETIDRGPPPLVPPIPPGGADPPQIASDTAEPEPDPSARPPDLPPPEPDPDDPKPPES